LVWKRDSRLDEGKQVRIDRRGMTKVTSLAAHLTNATSGFPFSTI